ncbi:MAG: hypothetical protein UHY58_04655 [Alistipes sp.]|nr:hypothetical protein [Alistipes sp.]
MKRLLLLFLATAFTLSLQAQNRVNEERSDRGIQITQEASRVYRKVLFWTNDSFDSYIKVYVNGRYQGKITKRYSSAPSCGNPNCVTFEFLVQKGKRYEFYGVDASGRRYVQSHQVTLSNPCNPICLRSTGGGSTGKTSTTGGGGGYNSGSLHTTTSGASSTVSEEERRAAQELGRNIGAGLGEILARSGRSWDPDCHRFDLGIGWGVNYGGLGVALNWQAPVVFGLTVGVGYNPVYEKYYGSNKSVHWNAGIQMWCTDNWNFELGAGTRYFKSIDQTKTAFVMSTNYQHQIYRSLGIKGGIGFSLSGGKDDDMAARFEWNLGIVVRLFAR